MVVDAGRATAEDSKSSVERKAERATMMCFVKYYWYRWCWDVYVIER